MAFDLSSVLREASNTLDASDGREQIEYIDISLIKADARNFYSLDGIEDLAANIELCGLQQPIRVRPDEAGTYTVVSGHRRRAALSLLAEEGKAQFKSVACIVEHGEVSAALQELRLIYANSDTRHMSAADISKQAERVEALLYQLKEEGVEFPGRMRDHVAEACKVSKSKLSRLKVIRDGLVPEYTANFEAGTITEQAAYALARLPEALQRRLFKINPTIGGYNVEQITRAYASGKRWEPKQSCPDGSPCKRGDAFLRHDTECISSEVCGGDKCCLNCSYGTSRYYACDRSCAKLQKLRKKERDEEKAAIEAGEKEKRTKLLNEVRASCERLARAADAAGLPDDTRLSTASYRPGYSIGLIRKFAKGDFDGANIYGNDFSATEIRNYPEVCKTLKCSADYIAGLTDELQPAAAEPSVQTGPPTASGWYAARFSCDGFIMRKLVWYDNCLKKFYFDNSHGRSIEAECIGWIRLPGDF